MNFSTTVLLALLLLLPSPPRQATATAAMRTQPQVWFNVTNYVGQSGVDGAQGWNILFDDPDAPWPAFMEHVQVFAAAGIWKTPDAILTKAFTKLKAHHVAFAMESLAQSWVHQPKCGEGVESFYDPPGARLTANKIKAAGGELVYVAMDEPLWYGHYYSGHDACHSSLRNTAERAAAIIAEYQKVFPHVIVGDIEPFPAITEQPNWRADYREWMADFEAATGQPIAFLHVDINWPKPDWPASLQEAAAFARERGLTFGIIYNGSVTGAANPTTKLWLDSAVGNFMQIETRLRIIPDQVIFHSWDRFPAHAITDSTDRGEDYLVTEYAKLRLKGGR
jgi:hypothetical protein